MPRMLKLQRQLTKLLTEHGGPLTLIHGLLCVYSERCADLYEATGTVAPLLGRAYAAEARKDARICLLLGKTVDALRDIYLNP